MQTAQPLKAVKAWDCKSGVTLVNKLNKQHLNSAESKVYYGSKKLFRSCFHNWNQKGCKWWIYPFNSKRYNSKSIIERLDIKQSKRKNSILINYITLHWMKYSINKSFTITIKHQKKGVKKQCVKHLKSLYSLFSNTALELHYLSMQ